MRACCRRALAVFALLSALLIGAAPASASSVGSLTVANGSPSNGAGARTQYVVSFVTSASGALAAGGTIDVTFPAGTTFGNYGGGGVFDGTTRIGNCPTPDAEHAPDDLLDLRRDRRVHHGAAGVQRHHQPRHARQHLRAHRRHQLGHHPHQLAELHRRARQHALEHQREQHVTVQRGRRAHPVRDRLRHDRHRRALQHRRRARSTSRSRPGRRSATTAAAACSTAPTRIGNCPTPRHQHAPDDLLDLRRDRRVHHGAAGVQRHHQPRTPGNTYALTVATSSDTTPTSSQSYTVAPANTLSNISVNNTSPSNGAGARTQYVISFATTATGGLSSTAQSTIDVTFPAGTTFANYGGGGVFDGATRIGNCPTPNASTRQTHLLDLRRDRRVHHGAAGVQRHHQPRHARQHLHAHRRHQLRHHPHQLAELHRRARQHADQPGGRSRKLVPVRNDAVHRDLHDLADGRALEHRPEHDRRHVPGRDDVRQLRRRRRVQRRHADRQLPRPPTPPPARRTCSIFAAIGASTTARLEFNGITNPARRAATRMTVATSSDTSVATSSQYGIAVDTVPPETTLVSGPPGTTTNPQPTFTFSSSEPGSSFECSLDGASFAPCTSPFVAPATRGGRSHLPGPRQRPLGEHGRDSGNPDVHDRRDLGGAAPGPDGRQDASW